MAIGSKIELGRIVLYVFFPVAVFLYFNFPGSYEEYMTQKKKEIYPPDEECYKPPTSVEGLLKAREKILEERRKERAQNKTE
ncbi:protein PET100 homolog, mitochondrial-like [Orbicella faveolata]|uniref:protein PET100 homolog, mitochondrial-like n=1 Tax=Orbicella faveolata TaxID=48498 RepID=UPI0009E352EC|nr:protein PET100 homolog, mitochondrial-like [Orbicella faveolata]